MPSMTFASQAISAKIARLSFLSNIITVVLHEALRQLTSTEAALSVMLDSRQNMEVNVTFRALKKHVVQAGGSGKTTMPQTFVKIQSMNYKGQGRLRAMFPIG